MTTEATKNLVDGISIVTVVSTINAWLPPLAAGFTIIWTVIRIYETKTVQKALGKSKERPDDS